MKDFCQSDYDIPSTMYQNSCFSLPLQCLMYTLSRVLYFLHPLSTTFFPVDCSLTDVRLPKVFFSEQPSFFVILKVALRAPTLPPTVNTMPLTSLLFQRICVLVSLSSYPPLWWFVISMITVIFCCFFHMCLKNNTFWYCWVGELFHKVKCYSCIPCLCKRSWLTVSS